MRSRFFSPMLASSDEVEHMAEPTQPVIFSHSVAFFEPASMHDSMRVMVSKDSLTSCSGLGLGF